MVFSPEHGVIMATRTALYRISLAPTVEHELIYSGFANAMDLAVANGAAFIADNGTSSDVADGTLWKIAL